MNQSEQINELATALAKAQAEMKSPPKDRTGGGGKYTYKYSDLATVIDTTKPVLSKHGLSVSQQMDFDTQRFYLATLLAHASGQWIQSRMPLPENKAPQELGGYLTYFRRYALCAILGIAADDDDDAKNTTSPRTVHPAQPEPEDGIQDREVGYRIPFGKFAKRSLEELDPTELGRYIEWLESDAQKKNKPIQGVVKEFIERSTVYLAARENFTLDEPGSNG
jgi:hypothetical protein